MGLSLGQMAPGSTNALVDVSGVEVGHVDIADDGLNTGLTVVLPYPAIIKERRLFIGRWSLGAAVSGLGVAEDFGTFSSPIALVPLPVFGRVYEAMIHQGIKRDSGLSTDTGWPPIVVGVNDSVWNNVRQVRASVREKHVDAALAAARGDAIREGNVGIGGGLQAFGLRGGVGTASRRVGPYLVGALVVANGGLPGGLSADGRALQEVSRALQSADEEAQRARSDVAEDRLIGPQEFVVVLATDAPLLPFQLRSLAQRAALGTSRCGLWNAYTRAGQVLAFSTVEAAAATEAAEVLEQVPLVAEQDLYGLFAAAAEAVEEAVLSALVAAEALTRGGRTLPALTKEAWARGQGEK